MKKDMGLSHSSIRIAELQPGSGKSDHRKGDFR
jgi:hypothetical protein